VHKFCGHTRSVIGIIFFPKKQLFLSCSLDWTVRMYSLNSFKEIYCLQLKEQALGMEMLDDVSFYIFSAKRVMIWNLNHINSLFAITKYFTYLLITI
jgi:WD40 repeat protein